MKNVCVFGASITSGRSDIGNGGWCDLLKRQLLKKDIVVYNLGISGDTTTDLLKRIKNEAQAREPAAIMIALGGNDSRYYFIKKEHSVPLQNFRKNFIKLMAIARSFTDDITIVGLTKVDEAKINSVIAEDEVLYRNGYLEKYDNDLERIAGEEKIRFIPTFDLVLDFEKDGLHPSVAGHKKIFKRVARDFDITKLLEDD